MASEALGGSKYVIGIDLVHNGKDGVVFLFQGEKSENSVLSDLGLPDIDLPLKSGHEVLQELKASAATGEIPVIMLTTLSTQEDILASYQEQASRYTVKPSEADQYFDFVKMFDRFCGTLK